MGTSTEIRPHLRLAAWLRDRDMTLADFAKLIDRRTPAEKKKDPDRTVPSIATVSLWCAGKATPEAPARESIEIATGIPGAAWRTPEHRAHLARLREAVDRLRSAVPSKPAA